MSRSWFICVLFFVSGACGLVYQIVWSRMLSLLFGRSVLAVGVVLAAFMAGLALGSYLLGKVADKSRNPLRLYALYEVAIGATALVASALLANIAPLYLRFHAAVGDSPAALSATRFLLAFLILIMPTVLMGATLPILSRALVRQLENVGHELGKLYAVNTLGAVVGAACAGFLLIRLFGLQGTVWVAAAGNFGVGLLALSAARRSPAADPQAVEQPEGAPTAGSGEMPSRAVATLLLVVFALSGLTSFAYEIFWTRSLVFLLGNTTYAFTLMLTAFLSGIALGGYGVRFLADRVRSRLRLFAVIEVLIGLVSAASLPVLFFLLGSETVRSLVHDLSVRTGSLILSESAVALVLMLVPATLVGATLPLMGRIFVNDLRCTGSAVGKVYAVNTLGNVVGALLPGLLVLPMVGIQRGILLMAALNGCLGFMVLLAGRKCLKAVALPTGIFLALAVGIAGAPASFQFPSESQTAGDAVLFYEEGALVTTKVWSEANTGNRLISADGVNIGGTDATDYKQQILAHLPKLLLRSYRSELSIGLGSGILLGESGRHGQLERMVCVEIAPSVVRGAELFRDENHGVVDDPRTEMVVDDIGHYLQTTTERFDIISADEKTDEKYASNSFSYSKDYYELLRQRLSPEGLLIQWVPAALPPEQFHLVLRTFLEAFPHVSLWYFPPVGRFFVPNTFLVGSNVRIDPDPERIDRLLSADPASFRGIGKYGLKTAEDVLSHFVAAGETLRRAVPAGPVNSFDRPYYEFYSPVAYAQPWRQRTMENNRLLMSVRGPDFERFLGPVSGPAKERLRRAAEAEGLLLRGYDAQLNDAPYTTVKGFLDRAVALAPRSEVLRNQAVAYLMERFRSAFQRQDHNGALRMIRRAARLSPENAQVREDYGVTLLLSGQHDAAAVELQRALELDPGLVSPRRPLGAIYASRGKTGEAVKLWREALSIDPDDLLTRVFLGGHLARHGSIADAATLLRGAYALAPGNPAVINGYAEVLYLAGDRQKAREVVREGGRYHEGNPAFEGMRTKILGEGR